MQLKLIIKNFQYWKHQKGFKRKQAESNLMRKKKSLKTYSKIKKRNRKETQHSKGVTDNHASKSNSLFWFLIFVMNGKNR